MRILAIERALDAPDDEFTPELALAEALRAWQLNQQGVIRELYFRADETSAVLVLECADLDEAKSVLASMPLVRAGLIDFEVLPLRAYPGFERLFARELATHAGDA